MTVQLVTAPGADVPPLGWHGANFDPDEISPIYHDPWKPLGGLWTSPLVGEDGGTAWSVWCTSEGYRLDALAHPTVVLRADPGARVYVIDSYADLCDLGAAFPAPLVHLPLSTSPGVDWVAAAGDLDAIWLTAAGEWATRTTRPGMRDWGCETVLWLRPALTAVGLAAAA